MELLFLMVLFILLFMPLLEIDYRYSWDWNSGQVDTNIVDTGFFKNIWSELTKDYERITVYGRNAKFPIVYFGIITQLFLVFKRGEMEKYTIWLYIGNILMYGVILLTFLSSFSQHKIDSNLRIGSFLFFSLMIGGIVKEIFLKRRKAE